MAVITGTEFNDIIAPNNISLDVDVDGVPVEPGEPLPPGSDLTGDDLILGELGNDNINGGDGNDTIDGGVGNDTVNGGNGFDTVDYTESLTNVIINLTTGIATSGDDTDQISSIEQFIGSEFNDTIIGDSADNILEGGDGEDFIKGGAGNDELYGDDSAGTIAAGELNNTVDYSETTTGVNVNLDAGTATGAESGNDTLSNFASVWGGSGNDVLTGDEFDNTFRGGAGNDTIAGGDGIDIIDFGSATAGVSVNLNSSTASDGQGGTDTVSEIEGVIGGSGNDTLTGTILEDFLSGGAGNDAIDGLEGADTLNGGAGNDTVNGGAGSDTIEVGAEGIAFGDVLDGGADADTLLNIGTDNIAIATWSASNNIETINAGVTPTGPLAIVGFADASGANNSLDFSATTLVNVDFVDGGAGNDTIIGSTGDIDIFGGAGNDSLTGGGNKSNIEGNDGNDTITGGLSDNVLDGGAGNDSITGAGAGKNTLIGGDGNDILIGGTTENTFDAGAGNDTITGGDDKDFITLGAGVDTASAGAGDDTISIGDEGLLLSESIDGGDGVDTLENIGTGNLLIAAWNSTNNIEYINGQVGGIAQAIVGNASANTLNFSGTQLLGVEYIDGSGGNDTITGSAGENDIRGGAGADRLFGGNEKNILDGGIGADILVGGDKEDTLIGGDGNDNLTGGLGTDLLQGNGNNDILNGGDEKDTLDGGAGADTLNGDAGEDDLLGQAGNDILNGGADKDFLTGGAGADTLNGGADIDTFIFESGFGLDRIVGFEDGGDYIDLKAFTINFGSLTATQSGANTIISSSAFGTGNTITLLSFSATNVDASDFLF
jgi:Ca2+-binding RTX toxin-like protein